LLIRQDYGRTATTLRLPSAQGGIRTRLTIGSEHHFGPSSRGSGGDGRQSGPPEPIQRAHEGTFISHEVLHQTHTPGGKVDLGAVDLEPELVEAIAQAALRTGLTIAVWRRRDHEEQLQREKA